MGTTSRAQKQAYTVPAMPVTKTAGTTSSGEAAEPMKTPPPINERATNPAPNSPPQAAMTPIDCRQTRSEESPPVNSAAAASVATSVVVGA